MWENSSSRRNGRAIAVYVKKLSGEEVVACLSQDTTRARAGFQEVWLKENKDRQDLVRQQNGEIWFRVED